MNVFHEIGGELRSCFLETADARICCLMDREPEKEEVILIDDDDDEVEMIENPKCLLKMKSVFPCAISTGCNETRKYNEPEHLLGCLLVKTLKELKTPTVHVEQVCTYLSKRYDYFYKIPPYELVQEIKELIKSGDFPENIKIVLNKNDHCALFPNEEEIINLDSDDEVDIKQEMGIEIEYDTMISMDMDTSDKFVTISTQTYCDDMIVPSFSEDMIAPTEHSEKTNDVLNNLKDCDVIQPARFKDMPLLTDEIQTKISSCYMNVYAAEEERELQRRNNFIKPTMTKSPPKRMDSIDRQPIINTNSSKDKNFWLNATLLSITNSNWSSFTVVDVVNYLKTIQKVEEKYMYQKVYSAIKSNKIFERTADKKWRLIFVERTTLETTKPIRPSVIRKNTPTKTLKENIQPLDLSCNAPKVSLLIIFAKILRCKELTKEQIYKEISSQYPYYKAEGKDWKKIVNTYLNKFCIKFSSQLNTSYSISEDTYIYIYKNEVIHKEFNFSN